MGQDAFGFLTIHLDPSAEEKYFELTWEGKLPVYHKDVWPEKLAYPLK